MICDMQDELKKKTPYTNCNWMQLTNCNCLENFTLANQSHCLPINSIKDVLKVYLVHNLYLVHTLFVSGISGTEKLWIKQFIFTHWERKYTIFLSPTSLCFYLQELMQQFQPWHWSWQQLPEQWTGAEWWNGCSWCRSSVVLKSW